MEEYISRQAAIDALDKRFDDVPMELTMEILQLRRDLRELPSAQRKGKWMGMLFVCSVCGNGVRLMGKPVFEYCPWCGARTEKGKNDGRSDIES